MLYGCIFCPVMIPISMRSFPTLHSPRFTHIIDLGFLDKMMYYLSKLFGWSTRRIVCLILILIVLHTLLVMNFLVHDPKCTDDALWDRSYQVFEKHAVRIGESAERQYAFEARPDDIFIVGSMKSGTTWLQHIMHLIRTKGDSTFDNIYNVTWYLPNYYLPYNLSSPAAWNLNGDQPASPRIFKTHEMFKTIPKSKNGVSNTVRYVVISRRMADTAWSFIKFMPRMYGCDTSISWNLFHRVRLSQASRKIGDTYRIINSFYRHRAKKTVLWLFFEDLTTDLKFCIKKLAYFMQIDLTNDEIDKIAEKSTYSWMNSHKKKFNFDLIRFAKSLGVNADWAPIAEMISSHSVIRKYLEELIYKLTITADQKYFDQSIGIKYGFHTFEDLQNRTKLLNLKNHESQFLTI